MSTDAERMAAHVVPETSSEDQMHVMDDTCWCKPLTDTNARQIRHRGKPS